jgi:hypothetical protein
MQAAIETTWMPPTNRFKDTFTSSYANLNAISFEKPSADAPNSPHSSTPFDDALICVLSPLGAILSVSYPCALIAGSSIMDYIHPEDLDQFISSMSAIISNGTSLDMVFRMSSFSPNYCLFEAFGRPTSEQLDVYQGQTHGMVLAIRRVRDQVIRREDHTIIRQRSSSSLWSRRQASKRGAHVPGPLAPVKLSYEAAQPMRLNAPRSAHSAGSSTPLDSIYDLSSPSCIISPYEDDGSTSSAMGFNPPPSATPSLVSFEEAPMGHSASMGYTIGVPGVLNFSYFDDEIQSPNAEEFRHEDNAPANQTYWDNVTNSELVSPLLFAPPSVPPLQFCARSKSYSLPGVFDAPSAPQYPPPFANPPATPTTEMDFSGYTLSSKSEKRKNKSKPPPKTRRKNKHPEEVAPYVCSECGVKESPEWRKGPNGPKTMCNACGLRYAKWTRKKSVDGRK